LCGFHFASSLHATPQQQLPLLASHVKMENISPSN